MGSSANVNTIRIVLDIVMLIIVALPAMVYKFGNIKPTRRGFFCDDESIRYPYHEGSVSTAALILVGGFTNLFIIIICEVLHYKLERRNKTNIVAQPFSCNVALNPCLYTVCGYMWVLGFGMMVTQAITDVGKFSVGRLRPHFIDGCKPVGNITLADCKVGQYFEDFKCSQTDQKILYDLRLSFPSGHASQGAFTMVLIACYIQQRVPRFPHSYLFKHVLQTICILMAWFCGISRVMDYKHHPTDVLAGFVIGTVIALLSARYIVKGYRNPYVNGPYRRVVSKNAELQYLSTAETGAAGEAPGEGRPVATYTKSSE